MNSRKIYFHAGIDAVYTTATTAPAFGYIRHSVSLFALALLLVIAPAMTRAQVTPTATPNMEYGIVTGGIYSKLSLPGPVRHPMLDYADQIFAEFKGLGIKWIRIEANWKVNYDPQYTFIVDKAHAYGLKVIVVLPRGNRGDFCQWRENRDTWFTDYKNELNRLATQVFYNKGQINAQADAYEIMNEPNQKNGGAPECPAGVFRMDGDSFAWLLRFVWRWKKDNKRTEKIVSGGTINSYFDSSFEQDWWGAFFGSGAFSPATGIDDERPFDYFGVHPYNELTPGDEAWKNETRRTLTGLPGKLNTVTRKPGTQLFVTEFGTALPKRMTDGMKIFRETGVLASVWYDYRDDHEGGFGLRGVWNESLQRYPAKPIWAEFKTMTGGKGDDDSESYWKWNRLPYGVIDFASMTSVGGWAYDPDTVDAIDVYLFINDVQVATMKAAQQRFDLVTAGVAANAAHGYTFQLPTSNVCRDIKVFAQNSRGGPLVLISTPQRVCPPPS